MQSCCLASIYVLWTFPQKASARYGTCRARKFDKRLIQRLFLKSIVESEYIPVHQNNKCIQSTTVDTNTSSNFPIYSTVWLSLHHPCVFNNLSNFSPSEEQSILAKITGKSCSALQSLINWKNFQRRATQSGWKDETQPPRSGKSLARFDLRRRAFFRSWAIWLFWMDSKSYTSRKIGVYRVLPSHSLPAYRLDHQESRPYRFGVWGIGRPPVHVKGRWGLLGQGSFGG